MLGSQEWWSGWNNIRNNSICIHYWLFFDRNRTDIMMSERVKNALLITGVIVIVGLIVLPVIA